MRSDNWERRRIDDRYVSYSYPRYSVTARVCVRPYMLLVANISSRYRSRITNNQMDIPKVDFIWGRTDLCRATVRRVPLYSCTEYFRTYVHTYCTSEYAQKGQLQYVISPVGFCRDHSRSWYFHIY